MVFALGKSSVHATAVAQDWLAATCFQDVSHLLYRPDVTPTDFFLFLKLLKELAGRTLPAKTLKTTWDEVTGLSAPVTSPPPSHIG